MENVIDRTRREAENSKKFAIKRYEGKFAEGKFNLFVETVNIKSVGADVKFSASFLGSIAEYVDPGLPFISLSKGLQLNTLRMMTQIIPQALRNPR
ncbi:hypothetical protein JHK82_047546 [Glycine max]|nr:hypothetical protein JHK86_047438 [Glycine max]KAG4943381.1 hypothetical protein JHK85_048027 [Glycine max]KAG5097692.1 hypothetical protein JHK82_047546 [Glycine max]KAG5102490.1 hypothetical protein JHK84_047459 [Glycine max]